VKIIVPTNQPEKYSTNWCKLNDVTNNTHWRSGFGWGTVWHLRKRDSMRAVMEKILTNETKLCKAATLGLPVTLKRPVKLLKSLREALPLCDKNPCTP